MIYGEIPTDKVVFAACDSNYFLEHAPSFVYSASDHKFDVHIHVVNPSDDVLSLAAILSSTADTKVTYTYHDVDLSSLDKEQTRALYASTRFQVAPHLIKFAGEMLILDIDCLIMKEFEFPKKPIAYFPREPLPGTTGWENEGTQVAAGAVYFHNDAQNVCEAVGTTLDGLPLAWFNDQIALNHVMRQVPEGFLDKFDGEFMDWEFKEGTAIWTGKGPRKYDNQTYVAKKEEYNRVSQYTSGVDRIILKPRMDIMFKRNGLTGPNTVKEPIREHWVNFVEKQKGIQTLVIEAPKWYFNNTICEYFNEEQTIFVPHVEKEWWGGGDNCRYYMQTVFPWLFTVDSKGYLGGSRYKELFDPEIVRPHDSFETLQNYIKSGGTKFKNLQGEREWKGDEPYVLVPLQIPHDETIKYHSDVTVPEMVMAMCEWADNGGMKVVFKGHPVNIGSMQPLIDIIEQYDNVEYVTDYPINQMIEEACAVFVVNSGTGQEAMLYDRPVVVFGRCDYEGAVIKGDVEDLAKTWESVLQDDFDHRKTLYRRWFGWFVDEIAFDTRNQ